MWDETQTSLIASWRDIVEEYDSRLGLMSSTMEFHSAEGRNWSSWWQALASKEEPAHRPHFWDYGDTTGPSLINSIAVLQQNRSIQPEKIESGPEIECFPYGRWNKSFRQIGAQMALAHILGSTSLNISLYDFMGNYPDDEPERAVFLNMWKPVCDWLADEFPMSLISLGIGLSWSPDLAKKIHTDSGGNWHELVYQGRGWARWLGAAGFAFSMTPSPLVNAIGGKNAWGFADAELEEWLHHGLMLDGVAASILLERGFGEFLGITGGRFITQDDCAYAVEQTLRSDSD